MLAGHAGDVENDADDVDGPVSNTYISFENAVKYSMLLAKTNNKTSTNILKTSTPSKAYKTWLGARIAARNRCAPNEMCLSFHLPTRVATHRQ